ncbi:hypothetical protein ANN_02378 [Periplaneta americana]|uniref:Uncharacterized protein n=1 Tax=Periplaneta americana TaxID=6978 RepID=A0ABQ8TW74_PERAM|nr:hypothetical protein ANN_02378 [Periplaneta americana]
MASVVRVSSRLGASLYWGPAAVTVSRGNTPRTYYTYSPEPAQPLNRDPKWVSAKEAVQCIQSVGGRQEDAENRDEWRYIVNEAKNLLGFEMP